MIRTLIQHPGSPLTSHAAQQNQIIVVFACLRQRHISTNQIKTLQVTKNGLSFSSSCLHLVRIRITSIRHHSWIYHMLGIKLKVPRRPSKHSTNRATPSVPEPNHSMQTSITCFEFGTSKLSKGNFQVRPWPDCVPLTSPIHYWVIKHHQLLRAPGNTFHKVGTRQLLPAFFLLSSPSHNQSFLSHSLVQSQKPTQVQGGKWNQLWFPNEKQSNISLVLVS